MATVDNDGLSPPAGNNHYEHRSLTIMDNQHVNMNFGTVPSKCTVSWTAEVHAYPTGASLEDEDTNHWKKKGEVHILVAHRGTIEYAFETPFLPSEHIFTLTTGIECEGAQAKLQFPASNSGVESGYDTQYKPRFSRRMPMYNGTSSMDFLATSEKDFTLSNCKQESAVMKNMAEMKLLSSWSTQKVQKQEIYGLSHFTLATGDYEDLNLTFSFNETWGGLKTRRRVPVSKFEVVKLDYVPGVSPSPEDQATITAAAAATFKAANASVFDFLPIGVGVEMIMGEFSVS